MLLFKPEGGDKVAGLKQVSKTLWTERFSGQTVNQRTSCPTYWKNVSPSYFYLK